MSKENRKGCKQKRGSSRQNYFKSYAMNAVKGSKGKHRYEAMLTRHGLKR